MRKLLIVNTVVVLLGTGCSFLFAFFGFGACPIIIAPVITSCAAYIIIFLVFIVLPFLLIFNIVQAFKNWRDLRWCALLPLLVLCTFIPIGLLPGFGKSLGEKRFMSRLQEYDKFVEEFKANNTEHEEAQIINPISYNGLAYIVLAYENEPNVLVVEFLVGGMGPPPKHTAFLYTSSGEAKEGSKADKRWYRWKRMNKHWFRVTD